MEPIRATRLGHSASAAAANAGPGAADRAAPATATLPTAALAMAAPQRPDAERALPPSARPHWNHQLQSDVASAQQALDYLDRVGARLESVKGELAARLSGSQNNGRQLEARLRQLGAALDARTQSSGGGVDARLDFQASQAASQRFRIRGLDMDGVQAGAPQTLAFSVGGVGGSQLSVAIEPDMTRQEIARRFDRALAPVKIRASLDAGGDLLFATPESAWPLVKDNIALSGRGRVATDAEAALAPEGWDTGDPDALRQNLRDVVQALARVHRSRDAASAALSAATMQAARAETPVAEAAALAQDFAGTAASPNYDALLKITSALAGISRGRVLALLGLR